MMRLRAWGVEFLPYDVAEADAAAELWLRGARHLAFADRASLATAAVDGRPILTADRAWSELGAGVRVEIIR